MKKVCREDYVICNKNARSQQKNGSWKRISDYRKNQEVPLRLSKNVYDKSMRKVIMC